MIHRLTSDLPSFKTLVFGPGLNILLADKSEGASDRQSRNGAGKTSFVELVHFLFGSTPKPASIFRSEALVQWVFEMRADIGSEVVDVARSGAKPSRIRITGDTPQWPLQPTFETKTGERSFTNDQWCALLGAVFFDLPLDGTEEWGRFSPKFRSLFSYFARRQNSGGFQQPIQQSAKQQPWDQQVAISRLLGLDPNIPREF